MREVVAVEIEKMIPLRGVMMAETVEVFVEGFLIKGGVAEIDGVKRASMLHNDTNETVTCKGIWEERG